MTNPIAEIRQGLLKQRPEIEKVLPEHVSIDRFERITLTALQRQPDLLSCDRKSLFGAVMNCAQDGLIPDGREAALVKFKDSVAYMPMVSGILKKVRQSGELASITAQVVYEGDTFFDYWIDDEGEHLSHRPDILSDAPGAVRCVYAMARTKDGSTHIEVLRLSDIEKIRSSSRSADRGPWATWWSEMAKKSAIRRLAKRLPMSTDLERVVTRDDQFYNFERDVTPAESAPSAEQSLGVLSGEPEPESDPEPEPEPEPQQTPEPDSNTVPLADHNGEIVGEYKQAGSYLKAVTKLVNEAGDRLTAQQIWHANEDALGRLAEDEKHSATVIDLSNQIAAMPSAETESEGEGEAQQEGMF